MGLLLMLKASMNLWGEKRKKAMKSANIESSGACFRPDMWDDDLNDDSE